jgi:hypothetical protein
MPKRRRKRKEGSSRPKGSYPLPTGDSVTEGIWVSPEGRRLRVRVVHHAEPDLEVLARSLIALAEEVERSKDDASTPDDRAA